MLKNIYARWCLTQKIVKLCENIQDDYTTTTIILGEFSNIEVPWAYRPDLPGPIEGLRKICHEFITKLRKIDNGRDKH